MTRKITEERLKWYGHVRGSVKVAAVTRKITEERLKWYGHVRGSV